jgi:uncharacterized membrane protein
MKASLKTLLIGFVAVGILIISIAVYATNVSHVHHPNLAAAQTFIEKAINKISAAQVANEYDMEGHAAKAKSFLDQAYAEIKLAAQAANEHR